MHNIVRQLYNNILPYETRLRFYKLRNPAQYKALLQDVYSSERGNFSLRPYVENRCIFIHITKTAGTSVAKGLFNYLPYHYTAIDYRVIFGKKSFDDYYKFAFVRNPWDRTYSAYRYLRSGGWNEDDKRWGDSNLSEFDNFGDFVKNWLNAENIHKHIHFKPQYHFICDTKKQILLDYLAYFETIDEDFDIIRSKLNIDATLGQHNMNPDNDYRAAYDDHSRTIVAEVYAEDIELFGYSFEGIRKRLVPR